MQKLDLNDLTVTSFSTSEPSNALVAQQPKIAIGDPFCCTGCVSGCGINPTAGGCASGGGDRTIFEPVLY